MKIFKFKLLKLFLIAKQLLDLRTDFDEQGAREVISSGVDFRSGNAWGLIFAIFVASIGLNTNSTAVIIGAMLISPLMGPIVGAGYSLGTHDFDLLKKSTNNLIYAVAISIITSTIFFLFSPSSGVQSELLARTQPTFFDVLIAFFGGSAGIVAMTRKVKSNAIPGVAIATALMPPLCTVGYSIAHLEWSFAIGALYLFSINAIFILISTYLFVRLLGFRLKSDRNPSRDKIIHQTMTWVSVIVVVPSLVMAWYLHKKTEFVNRANSFITEDLRFANTFVASKEIEFKLSAPKIRLKLFGDSLSDKAQLALRKKMKEISGLEHAELVIDFIGRDGFTIDDLAKKFITKNEVIQLIKIEKNNKNLNDESISAKIINKINILHRKSVESVIIQNNKVDFIWKSKPTNIMIQNAEKFIYEELISEPPNFSHSITVK